MSRDRELDNLKTLWDEVCLNTKHLEYIEKLLQEFENKAKSLGFKATSINEFYDIYGPQ